jgi:hypothetical protein
MDYREHRVQPPLDAFVECVWLVTDMPDGRAGAGHLQRILPDYFTAPQRLAALFGARR